MIKKTAFAAAPEESRLTINGVLFELVGSRFRLAATDNKRMAITERQVTSSVEDFRVSVPRGFLTSVLKVTTKDVASKTATIGVSGTKIFYRLPGVTVYSTVMQGVFPPYQEALGLKLKHHIDCGVKELLSTLRRAMLVNSDLTAFTFSTGALRLQAVSSSVGAGTAEMDVDLTFEGDETARIGFNPSYYKDALEAMTAKRCRFLFEGPRNAGVLKELVAAIGADGAMDDASDDFVYAVMPALLPVAPQ
jgi:DNA polymerase-3 subunit beta